MRELAAGSAERFRIGALTAFSRIAHPAAEERDATISCLADLLSPGADDSLCAAALDFSVAVQSRPPLLAILVPGGARSKSRVVAG
jgi:hypothetical protein